MTRKIVIALIAFALILVVASGIYLVRQRSYDKINLGQYNRQKPVNYKENEFEEARRAIKSTLIYVYKNKILLPEENNGIKYVVKTFELTKEVKSTINIVVYQFNEKYYMWREGYEGGEGYGDRDLKEEAQAFRKLSAGPIRGFFSKYSWPGYIKKYNNINFIVVDSYFPPAGSFTRTYATYINNYLIEINYICTVGAELVDYQDYSKGTIYDKENEKAINKIEDALRE